MNIGQDSRTAPRGFESKTPTLSVVVITRNEALNIEGCLKSASWADELVVIDAESTDQTVEIAKRYTNRVYVRPWPGFGSQKNFGIEQASTSWILILDADERVTSELALEIRRCIEEWSAENVSAYRIPRRNHYYGRPVRWGGTYPDYQIRLFRKDMARYNDVLIHENLIVQGSVGTLHGHLDHFTERRINDHFNKFRLYTTLAAQEKSRFRPRVTMAAFLLRPAWTFVKTYVLRQGWRDGVRGLIVAVFASMYVFVKYAKLWETMKVSKQGGLA